jgi:hypothetical protein
VPDPSRDEALELLEDGDTRLGALVDRLSEDDLTRPATIGGGAWSAKDLIGHIASWGEIALEAVSDWQAAKMPRTQAEGFWTHQVVDRVNAENVESKRGLPLDEVVSRSAEIHRAVLAAIRSLGDPDWNSPPPYPAAERITLGHVLGGILSAPNRPFGHAFAHLPDLHAYVESLGPEAESPTG